MKKYGQFIKSFVFFCDIAGIVFAWVSAYFLRLAFQNILNLGNMPEFRSHMFLLILIVTFYVVASRLFKLYQPMLVNKLQYEFTSIIKTISLSLLMVFSFFYLFRRGFHYSRFIFIFFWVEAIFILFSVRIIYRSIRKKMKKRGYALKKTLIVGVGSLAQDIGCKIKNSLDLNFNVAGFLCKDDQDLGKEFCGIKVLGNYRNIKEVVTEEKVEQVIFALPAKEEKIIRPLIGYIDTESVDIKVALDLAGFVTMCKGIEDLGGHPIIALRESPFYGWSRVFKRMVDFVFSFFVLLFLSPLLLLVAIMVKKSSSGPCFYAQERMGLDGKRFKIYKFRTMAVDAETSTGPVWAKEDDPRRTRVGTFLRKTSLDELPQFYNVLRGDMSLVGPRPERPIFVDEFRQNIPQYMLRHKIKTGITGWAQINGFRGDTSLEKRIEYDLYYIENWSLWLDMVILLKTIPAVLKGVGAH